MINAPEDSKEELPDILPMPGVENQQQSFLGRLTRNTLGRLFGNTNTPSRAQEIEEESEEDAIPVGLPRKYGKIVRYIYKQGERADRDEERKRNLGIYSEDSDEQKAG